MGGALKSRKEREEEGKRKKEGRKEGRKEGEKINPKKERKYTGEIFLGKGAREQRQEWVS